MWPVVSAWTPRSSTRPSSTAGDILIVDADQAEGKAIGVTGTPTYVIDGERLDGGKSQDGLRERVEEIVDRLLAAPDA